jgi:hypothetical protein
MHLSKERAASRKCRRRAAAQAVVRSRGRRECPVCPSATWGAEEIKALAHRRGAPIPGSCHGTPGQEPRSVRQPLHGTAHCRPGRRGLAGLSERQGHDAARHRRASRCPCLWFEPGSPPDLRVSSSAHGALRSMWGIFVSVGRAQVIGEVSQVALRGKYSR